MADILGDRNSKQSALEDIENTLVSASTRLAQVQQTPWTTLRSAMGGGL